MNETVSPSEKDDLSTHEEAVGRSHVDMGDIDAYRAAVERMKALSAGEGDHSGQGDELSGENAPDPGRNKYQRVVNEEGTGKFRAAFEATRDPYTEEDRRAVQ